MQASAPHGSDDLRPEDRSLDQVFGRSTLVTGRGPSGRMTCELALITATGGSRCGFSWTPDLLGCPTQGPWGGRAGLIEAEASGMLEKQEW